MRTSLYEYCQKHNETTLLSQWSAKNAPLTPKDVSYGSQRKIWWRCGKGHEWQTAVFARTGGSGCPYCAGKKVYPGENDLASLRPDIAAQWHPTKNKDLTPRDVNIGSHREVWWLCPKGHEWKAMVKTRVLSGTGCPVCAGKKVVPGENDLATTHPEIAAQWHPTKNGKLTPRDVVSGTQYKAWWICDKGHEWQARVLSRANQGAGCPVCTGKIVLPGVNDLRTFFPEVAAQWHPTKNGVLTPDMVTPKSNRKVWWICPLGHEYQAMIGGRVQSGSGCPYCTMRKVLPGFNDLATRVPEVAAQWHPSLNGGLTPSMVMPGSHQKVWWECPNGHVWKAVVYSRACGQKNGCPVCAGRMQPKRMARYQKIMESAEILPRGRRKT